MSDYKFMVYCLKIPRKNWYAVKFIYNKELVDNIKAIEKDNRKWNAGTGSWEIKVLNLFNLIKIYKGNPIIFFEFGDIEHRQKFLDLIAKENLAASKKADDIIAQSANKEKWTKYKEELEITYPQFSKQLHALLKVPIKLYPHQIVATMFMNKTRSTLISHEMGLGKTLDSILYSELNKFDKVVVVTPNSLKFNYYNEVVKFTNSKAHILNWKKNEYTLEESKYIIFNYDFLNTGSKKQMATKWKNLKLKNINAVICDECQKLKNTKSNTYKNFKKIFSRDLFLDNNESKIFLSGTPAPNRAFELYSVLNQIAPFDFATKNQFYEYYCGMTYDLDLMSWVTNDEDKKLEELFHKISPYTHRKRKADVLTDLPDKTYQKIILELDPKENKLYADVERNVANELFNNTALNALTIMLRLRQLTAKYKIKHVTELIENVLETGEKIIVVDFFKESLYELKEKFGEIAALHTGDQSVEERNDLINAFQDPKSNIKIFLASIQTANYGLTLTAASKMLIITLPYSVGEYDQVADRCHRIGQKSAVNIYPIIFRDTIDEYVYSSIESKRGEIIKVMDNEDYESTITETVVSEVINALKNKYK